MLAETASRLFPGRRGTIRILPPPGPASKRRRSDRTRLVLDRSPSFRRELLLPTDLVDDLGAARGVVQQAQGLVRVPGTLVDHVSVRGADLEVGDERVRGR